MLLQAAADESVDGRRSAEIHGGAVLRFGRRYVCRHDGRDRAARTAFTDVHKMAFRRRAGERQHTCAAWTGRLHDMLFCVSALYLRVPGACQLARWHKAEHCGAGGGHEQDDVAAGDILQRLCLRRAHTESDVRTVALHDDDEHDRYDGTHVAVLAHLHRTDLRLCACSGAAVADSHACDCRSDAGDHVHADEDIEAAYAGVV